MKFILKESQLINIFKSEFGATLNESLIAKFLDAYGKDMSSGDNSSEYSGGLNPNFNYQGLPPENFDQIDIWPVNGARLTSGFGPRNIGGNASKNHKGCDLGIPSGTPVYAVANGKVKSAKNTEPNGCGGFVKIKHKDYITKYCHLSQWSVSRGDEVAKGQQIGLSGGTKGAKFAGNSQGPHLHYEVLVNNKQVDPVKVHGALS
jgi:murein DD-endopeptidase MepM/ murein hydrolase activator NlpD